jgi:hypothetical protein
MSMNETDAGTVMVWLHGYYGGKANDTTFNMKGFESSAKALGAYCADHGDISIMSASKSVFGE